jgi:hypothetical protein
MEFFNWVRLLLLGDNVLCNGIAMLEQLYTAQTSTGRWVVGRLSACKKHISPITNTAQKGTLYNVDPNTAKKVK